MQLTAQKVLQVFSRQVFLSLLPEIQMKCCISCCHLKEKKNKSHLSSAALPFLDLYIKLHELIKLMKVKTRDWTQGFCSCFVYQFSCLYVLEEEKQYGMRFFCGNLNNISHPSFGRVKNVEYTGLLLMTSFSFDLKMYFIKTII